MEKNTSSASLAETPWRSFLRAFPASQSNSVIFDKSIKAVYYRNIQRAANGGGMGAAYAALSISIWPAEDAARDRPNYEVHSLKAILGDKHKAPKPYWQNKTNMARSNQNRGTSVMTK